MTWKTIAMRWLENYLETKIDLLRPYIDYY